MAAELEASVAREVLELERQRDDHRLSETRRRVAAGLVMWLAHSETDGEPSPGADTLIVLNQAGFAFTRVKLTFEGLAKGAYTYGIVPPGLWIAETFTGADAPSAVGFLRGGADLSRYRPSQSKKTFVRSWEMVDHTNCRWFHDPVTGELRELGSV